VFSGAGLTAIAVLVWIVRKLFPRPPIAAPSMIQSPAISVSPTVTQSPSITVSPTFNNSVVVPPSNSNFSQARYAEWQKLDTELRACIRTMGATFVPLYTYRPGDPRTDPGTAIERGYDALRGSLLIANVLIKSGLMDQWNALVIYVHKRHEPREPDQRGVPTPVGFDLRAAQFLALLGETAREDLGA
jgi:hypothetical protein